MIDDELKALFFDAILDGIREDENFRDWYLARFVDNQQTGLEAPLESIS